MKKLLVSLIAIATISLTSFGQAPEGFKYQAVVRDAGNLVLNSQSVGIRLTIQQGSIGGASIYTETFAITTNAYGLVNLEIGTGTTADDFSLIDWATGPYFMETAVDVTGGTSYAVMGTNQLMSVPYALHAKTAENVINDQVDDADADPSNEMNASVVLNGTDLETTDGNGTIVTDLSSLQDGVNDADSDPSNEMNASVVLNGTDLETTDGNGTIVTDLSSLQDGVNDADSDPANEIQSISRTGTTVTLSSGGTFEDSVSVYTAGTGVDITNNVVSLTVTNVETLTMLQGTFDPTGTVIYAGQGYTVVKDGVGEYTITFNTPFSLYPAVTYSTNLDAKFVVTNVLGVGSVSIVVKDSAGTLVDPNAWISFIAVGAQ